MGRHFYPGGNPNALSWYKPLRADLSDDAGNIIGLDQSYGDDWLSSPDSLPAVCYSPPEASARPELMFTHQAELRQFAPHNDQAAEPETLGGELPADLDAGVLAEKTIRTLCAQASSGVAETDWIVSVTAVSNDPYYTSGSQWDMLGDATTTKNVYGSQAGEAWAAGIIGSMKTVVGVIDTGIDYTHPELYLNIWLNQNEIPVSLKNLLIDSDGDGLFTFRDLNNAANAPYVADINSNGRIDAGDLLNDVRWENSVDEDGNGYRDDLVGWDFVNRDNDPFDDNGHGTHVSGTIGAIGGNGNGIAGINWNIQIVAMKFLAANGSGSTSGAVAAVNYFTNQAIATPQENFVATNNSWSGGGPLTALSDAIANAAKRDILFIAAAGNASANNNNTAIYPANYNTTAAAGYDAVISVASLTETGALSSFSNYGSTTVDLAAPGSSIFSTLPGAKFGTLSGTSMATPHVTGAAALYASLHPDATAAEIRVAILGSVEATASLSGKTVTGGRLDISDLIQWTGSTPPPSPPASPNYIYGTTRSDTLTGTAGQDVISGVPKTGTAIGSGAVDRLTGLAGADTFVLGDSRGVFYNDGRNSSAGTGDYALITDFATGTDKIQLSSKVADYYSAFVRLGSVSGLGIYADLNGNHQFDTRDELIGLLANVSSVSSSDFVFA